MNRRGSRLLTVVLALAALGVMLRLGLPEGGRDPLAPEAGTGPVVVGETPGTAERAVVVAHVDGDTIRLTAGERGSLLPAGRDVLVRLLEIDAPELDGPYRDAECFGRRASRALAGLLPVGSEVWVTRDQELRDPYDRRLLYLWDAQSDLVNLVLVRQGFARAVLFEPNDAHIDAMHRAEAEARDAARGLWRACG